MRRISCATAVLAATTLAWSCTGGQSGTETPNPTAGHGGMPTAATGGSGEGGREFTSVGGSGGRGIAGTIPWATAQGGGGVNGGAKQGGTGGRSDGFAPNATDDRVCACALAGRAALLRGRLIALDACEVRAEVEEVLAVPPDFTATIAVGDALDARRSQSCGDVPSLAAGDTALIMYVPPAANTGAGEALLASWSDPLVFGQAEVGEPIALPRSDQAKLLEPTSCASGFGPGTKATPAATPCKTP